MTRLLPLAMLTSFVLGCSDGEVPYVRTGTPRLKLEVRAAAGRTVDGWMATAEPGGAGQLFLSPEIGLTNDDIASTSVRLDESGHWQIVLRLNDAGGAKLASLSTDAVATQTGGVRNRLAFLIDGAVFSAPSVMTPITGGVCMLSGPFSEDEARRIAQGIVGP